MYRFILAATVVLILAQPAAAAPELIAPPSPADLDADGPGFDVVSSLMVRPPVGANVDAAAQIGASVALPHFRGAAFYRTDALINSGSMGAAGMIEVFAIDQNDGDHEPTYEFGARASGAMDDRNPGEWFLGAFASVNGAGDNAHGDVWLSAGWTHNGAEFFGGADFELHPAGDWYRVGFSLIVADPTGGIDVWFGASHESFTVRIGWLAGAPPHWWGRGTAPASSSLENSVMYVAIEIR